MSKLNEALIAVQSELKAPKNQRNNFGKYNYRSAEDILEAVKPLLKANGLSMTISDSVEELGGMVVITSKVVVSDGTDAVEATAQAGVDPNRKGMDIAQSFGSSSSYARKYAMNGMFLIDDTKDADASNDHKPKGKLLTNDIKKKMIDAVSDGKSEAVEKALKDYNVSEAMRKEILG
jgi:hypothetical protein